MLSWWGRAGGADRVCAVGGAGRAGGGAAGAGVCGVVAAAGPAGLFAARFVREAERLSREVHSDLLFRWVCSDLLWGRAWLGVGLVVDEALLGFEDLVAGEGGVAPAFDFDALAFEVLVDGEEVGDLLEHVGVDLGEVPDVFVAGVALADAENLLVAEALVEHLEDADGADLHDAAGEAGGVDEDEAVEGVAVVAEGAGDEAVVAGVVDGGVEVAVETEDVQFLVVLVLVDALLGDLDDSVDDFGGLLARRVVQGNSA